MKINIQRANQPTNIDADKSSGTLPKITQAPRSGLTENSPRTAVGSADSGHFIVCRLRKMLAQMLAEAAAGVHRGEHAYEFPCLGNNG